MATSSSLLVLLPSFAALPSTPPMRSLRLFPSRGLLPTYKDPILIADRPSKSHLASSLKTSESKGMTKLTGAEVIRSSGLGLGIDEGVGADAEEAILGDGAIFDRGFDWSSAESLLNKMSKWLVAGLFGLVILSKHDAEAMWIAMGSVLNSWLSITLKRILNHQRPVPGLRSDPGMPSSHAQSIFYAATFVILSLINWQGVNSLTVTIGILTFTCGSYFTWLRVSQKLHTVSQVVVGALLGLTFCGSWSWMWHSFVSNAFISSIWVRIAVVLGSITFCSIFLVYVLQNWLKDE